MAAGGNGDSSEKRHGGKVEIIPGCQVWCKTRFEEVQGVVTGYDQENGVLIIKSSNTQKPNSFDVNVINLRHIQKSDFKLVSVPKSGPPALSELDHAKLNARLRDAVVEKIKKAERTGINVSEKAQALFDTMSHYIPECKWNGDCIIVMDDVQIEPPYKPENCSGQKKDSLAHIRKMVEKFHNEQQNDN